jgi:hypothetical protein
MPEQDILVRKAELDATMSRAEQLYREATVERQKAERTKSVAVIRLSVTQRERVEGTAAENDVTRAEDALEAAHALVAQHHKAANEALTVVKRCDWQRDELIRKNPEVFAEEAEQLTQSALRALEACTQPMREAQTAYEAASAAWAPVARAMAVAGVPAWPLVSADSLRNPGQFAARPPSVSMSEPD